MGMWQRITLGLVLLSGCTAPNRLESDIPVRYTRELRVNTENKVRYCTRISEELGVRALRRLAETSDFEEVWVYIPRIKEWKELGINEANQIVDEKDPGYAKRSVDLDGHFLHEVAQKYPEFTIYHTHNVKKRIVSDTVFYNPECSLPSYEDLCLDLRILNFYAGMNRGHSIRFKSVSLLGVTEVIFGTYAREHYDELMMEEESVKNELSRLEGFNFLKPFEASVFKGSIGIHYSPLVKPK